MITSSVASFLIGMGGGGGKTLNVPKLTCASERLRNVLFSGLKYICIHVIYTINAVPFYYFWYCTINDSIPTKQ